LPDFSQARRTILHGECTGFSTGFSRGPQPVFHNLSTGLSTDLVPSLQPVIARSKATKQSSFCFAEPVIGRIRATRWMPIEMYALIDEAVKATSA
jgi:hypothetical protein